MQNTTPAWSRIPAARAILARIQPGDLFVRLVKPIPGPDHLVLTFAGKEELDRVRTAFVERTVGMTFGEANAAGKAQDYLAADRCHASVDAVLEGMFGDPNQWLGLGAAGAQERVRAGMRVSRQEAA